MQLLLRAIVVAAAMRWGIGMTPIANTYAEPSARLFASSDGQHGMKVIPEKRVPLNPDESLRQSRATVFGLMDDGRERTMWRRVLPNIPVQVVIEDTLPEFGPLVATLGSSEGDQTDKHWLILYDRKGKVIRDLDIEGLSGLMSPNDAAEIISEQSPITRRHIVGRWLEGSVLRFEDGALQIRPKSGHVVIISAETSGGPTH